MVFALPFVAARGGSLARLQHKFTCGWTGKLKKKENIYHRKEEIHTKETLTSKFEELENSKWSESNLYSLLKE